MSLFETIFGPSHGISPGQECARAVLVLAYGLLLVRVAGRRMFGKWSALDIVVSIIVGSNLSRTITGSAPLPGTLASTTLLMALHFCLAWAVARWRWASFVLEGRAIDLGRNGCIEEELRVRHAVSQADLDEALRQKGVETAAQTAKIVLEPSGAISVLK